MRISDWSSDVCSSDLEVVAAQSRSSFPRTDEVDGHGVEKSDIREAVDDAEDLSSVKQSEESMCAEADDADDVTADRQSDVKGKSVSERVDLGGGRIINKTKKINKQTHIRTKKQ